MSQETKKAPARSGEPCGRAGGGFTLIELMIVVAVIAVLAAISLPIYRDYVTRARLVDAISALSVMRAGMEQHYQDNRGYASSGIYTAPCLDASNQRAGAFALSCELTDTTYTITAAGSGQVEGFAYTIDHNGTRVTTGLPAGWGTAPQSGCWIQRKGQSC